LIQPALYASPPVSAESNPAPTLSVVVVTFRHGEALRRPLEELSGELREGDELVVVDNASGDGTPEVAKAAAPSARVIRNDENAGFPAACNLGAAEATGELLVFLNPDAVVAKRWRDAIDAPLRDGSGWAAWQALVTAEGGRVINTRGGMLHFTGIAWAGGAGEPVTGRSAPEPGFVSGACLAIPRARFERLGGFAGDFFLYHEDVDLSLRARLAGGALGVAVDARVDHEYEFDKGPAKWRYLERNRWATLIRTYPGTLLALLAPALIATELALVPASIAGGWFGQKLRASGDTLGALPRLLRERRAIQATRSETTADFARALTPALDSPYLGAASRSRLLDALLGGYWRVVLRLLGG
jgi:GT2 family glycosyltransferase